MDELLIQHKKQQKQLQAQITALKKTVKGGAADKTKVNHPSIFNIILMFCQKKQVAEQIALMENELNLNQEEEITNLKKVVETTSEISLENLSIENNDEDAEPTEASTKKPKVNRQKLRKVRNKTSKFFVTFWTLQQRKLEQFNKDKAEAELEAAQMPNPKKIEKEQLDSILSEAGLSIVDVFYKSL